MDNNRSFRRNGNVNVIATRTDADTHNDNEPRTPTQQPRRTSIRPKLRLLSPLRSSRRGLLKLMSPSSQSSVSPSSATSPSSVSFHRKHGSKGSMRNRKRSSAAAQNNVMRWLEDSCPLEIVGKVLAFTGPKTATVLQQTNRFWWQLLLEESTWRAMCEELYKVCYIALRY